jgi:O-antigen/teichoic acid export membrane protein
MRSSPEPNGTVGSGLTDARRLARGAGITLLGRVAGRGMNLMVQVVRARMLAPAGYGAFVIGWMLFRTLSGVATLGVDNGVVRFGRYEGRADNRALRQLLGTALRIVLSSTALGAAALLLGAPLLAERTFRDPTLVPVLRVFAVCLVLAAITRVLAAGSRTTQRIQYSVISEELVQPAANLVLLVPVALLLPNAHGAAAAATVSFLLAAMTAGAFVQQLFPRSRQLRGSRDSNVTVGSLLRYSAPTALAIMSSTFLLWSTPLIVGYFATSGDVGVYNAAAQIALLFILVLSSFNLIFSPMIASLHARREHARIGSLYAVATRWGLYLCLPAYLVIVSGPTAIMTAVFGPEYRVGASALVVLATGQFVNAAAGAVALLLIMTGHERKWMVLTVTALIAGLMANVVLVPRLGVLGAALGTGGAVALLYMVGLIVVWRVLRLWPYQRRYLKGLLASVGTVVTLIAARPVLHREDLLGMFVTLVAAYLSFGAGLLLAGLDAEDRELILAFRQDPRLSRTTDDHEVTG